MAEVGKSAFCGDCDTVTTLLYLATLKGFLVFTGVAGPLDISIFNGARIILEKTIIHLMYSTTSRLCPGVKPQKEHPSEHPTD